MVIHYRVAVSIDTLKENGQPFDYTYYEDWGNQRYEFTIFTDDDFDQDTTLQFGQIEVINPLMDDIQTGLDTLQISIGAAVHLLMVVIIQIIQLIV